MSTRPVRSHRGITLIETCMSTVVVGGLLGASISAVGNLSSAQLLTTDRARGYQLAEDLLSEAQMLPYMDPTLAVDQIGPSAAELTPGNRSLFNDSDDYANWADNGAQNKDGTVIPGFTGWKRVVTVKWVKPDAGFDESATATGYKKITVTVSKNGRRVASMSCIKTLAWNDAVWLNGAATASSVTTSRRNTIAAGQTTDTGTTLVGQVTGLVDNVLKSLLGR